MRKQLLEGVDDNQAKKIQKTIFNGLGVANEQDKSLFALIELVVLHNIPIIKLRDPSFMKHLNLKVFLMKL